MFFLAEPANNLMHRQLMAPVGVSFSSHRIDPNVDFVSSTDIWCRPVNFTNAPDGTLHVLDMYREVIEHPWSLPDEIRDKLDLESGRDRGAHLPSCPARFPSSAGPALGGEVRVDGELVAALENQTGFGGARLRPSALLVGAAAINPPSGCCNRCKKAAARLWPGSTRSGHSKDWALLPKTTSFWP